MKNRFTGTIVRFGLWAPLILWALISFAGAGMAASETSASSWGALQEAFDTAAEGETITLTGDLTAGPADAGLVVPKGKDLTLDLAGFVLDRRLEALDVEQGSVIRVSAGAMLPYGTAGQTGASSGAATR